MFWKLLKIIETKKKVEEKKQEAKKEPEKVKRFCIFPIISAYYHIYQFLYKFICKYTILEIIMKVVLSTTCRDIIHSIECFTGTGFTWSVQFNFHKNQ